MDLCTWDWGAIGSILGAGATFTAAGIALYIFNKWKYQKASEVVANEAKYAINEVFELNKVFSDLINFNFDNSIDLKRKIDTFMSLAYNSHTKLTFIQNTIYDDNKVVEKSIAEFRKIIVKLISIFTLDMDRKDIDIQIFRARVAIMKGEKNNEIELFDKYAIEVLENCKKIAMYKVHIQ